MSCDTLFVALSGSPPSSTGGTARSAPGGFCVSFPQFINCIEPDFNKMISGLVHLIYALICMGFIKFLSSPLPVFCFLGFIFAWWHNPPATEFLLFIISMNISS